MVHSGKSVKTLENRPILQPGLEVYLDAFTTLRNDRQIGFDVGFIPWNSVVTWCQFHGYTDADDIAVFERYVREMESVEREVLNKKRPPNGK